MIVDQLFNPKPLQEGSPYDLPGKDYDRPGDTPRRPRGEHNPYPYSKEEDDDHFREIFRKKREAAKKAEQRKLDEAMLLEDPVYRNFKRIGQYIAERKLTEPEILKIFADAEAGMTDKATGANRTFLGRGKDTAADFAGGVADALKGVWADIQGNSIVGGVDVAYDKATDALANLTGGQKGAVMSAIKRYRMLAKQYPKTAGLAKGALMAIAGLATGGAGLPAAAAFVYGLDSAIKGDKFSDIVRNASVAAATAWAASKIAGMFGGGDQAAAGAEAGGMGDPSQLPPFDDAGNLSPGFHISPESGTPYYNGELAPTPTDIAAGYGPGGAGADSVAGLADTGAAGFGGGTYTTMPGDQGGFIAQAQGIPFKDLEALNPQITNWNKLPPGTELQLPPSGPNTGSVWQGSTPTPQGPELLGGPAAGNAASPVADVAASAAVPAPSPLTFDPVTNSGTVTLPSGETMKASVFPVDGQFQPRLPIGAEKIVIPYNGQDVTGYVINNNVYFPKFPADAAAGTTASGAGTLSGVTAQQIYNSPVYQQIYAQEIARYGAEPSARAIQAAQQIATMKAKAAMVGAVREATEFTRTVKMRQLPVDKLIDQKLTTLSWALNESVGKPQGRSMHLTPLGVYTVFENIRRVAEAAVSDPEADRINRSRRNSATTVPLAPTFAPIDEYPPEPLPVPPRPVPAPTPKPAPTPAPSPAPTTPTGPGREELPDLYRPDMSGAPDPTEPPKNQSWFGKGLDYLDKGVKKVGGALSNFGHQFTTNVTKEKLKMNWHQAGKPSDSDQLSAWLVKQGVPIGVVNGIYSKMGLPVSAEPTTPTDPSNAEPQTRTGGAQRLMVGNNINPKTGQRWTVDDLEAERRARNAAPAPTPTPTPLDNTDGTDADTATTGGGAGAGAFGNMASQLASRPTTSSTGGTTTGVSGVGGGVVRHTASATNPNQPKPVTPTSKPAVEPSVPSSTAELPAGGGAGIRAANPFGSMASSLTKTDEPAAPKVRMASRIPKKAPVAEVRQARKIAEALTKPVEKMLRLVETKDDVKQIKQLIDQTFVKYGAVNESAFAVRNTLIEHVTQVGAQRRRKHSQQMAT